MRCSTSTAPNLRADADETLAAAVPEITKLGGRPNRIEGPYRFDGHRRLQPEALGSARADVRDWLAKQKLIPASTPIRGYGKSMPIAPNTTPDGKDDPEGRQRNRRVEVVFEGCA